MTREPEHPDEKGIARKDHYGSGKQPWDFIVEQGWGPAFAAGNALKYVKRHAAKNGADDLEKGRWYFARLREMSVPVVADPLRASAAREALGKLLELLTDAEFELLDSEPPRAA